MGCTSSHSAAAAAHAPVAEAEDSLIIARRRSLHHAKAEAPSPAEDSIIVARQRSSSRHKPHPIAPLTLCHDVEDSLLVTRRRSNPHHAPQPVSIAFDSDDQEVSETSIDSTSLTLERPTTREEQQQQMQAEVAENRMQMYRRLRAHPRRHMEENKAMASLEACVLQLSHVQFSVPSAAASLSPSPSTTAAAGGEERRTLRKELHHTLGVPSADNSTTTYNPFSASPALTKATLPPRRPLVAPHRRSRVLSQLSFPPRSAVDDLIDDTEDPALGVLHRQCQVAHVLGLSSPASASLLTTSFSSAFPSPSPSPGPAAYYSTLASKSAQTTAPSSVMPSPFTQIDIFDNNDCNIPSLNMPLAPSSLLSLPFSTLASTAALQEMNTTLESERRERLVSMTVSALVSLLQAEEPVATQEEEENEPAEQTGYETVGDGTGIESSSDEEHGEDDDDDDQGQAAGSRGRALSSADEEDDQESEEDEEDEESNPKRRSEAQGRAVRFVPRRRRARTDSSRSSRSVSQVSGKDRVNALAMTVGSAEDCQSLSSRSGTNAGVADSPNVPGLKAT